jgi:hypothetical protein
VDRCTSPQNEVAIFVYLTRDAQLSEEIFSGANAVVDAGAASQTSVRQIPSGTLVTFVKVKSGLTFHQYELTFTRGRYDVLMSRTTSDGGITSKALIGLGITQADRLSNSSPSSSATSAPAWISSPGGITGAAFVGIFAIGLVIIATQKRKRRNQNEEAA